MNLSSQVVHLALEVTTVTTPVLTGGHGSTEEEEGDLPQER